MSELQTARDLAIKIQSIYQDGSDNFYHDLNTDEAVAHIDAYVTARVAEAARCACKWLDDGGDGGPVSLCLAIMGDHVGETGKMVEARGCKHVYKLTFLDGKSWLCPDCMSASIHGTVWAEERGRLIGERDGASEAAHMMQDRLQRLIAEPRQSVAPLGTGTQWNAAVDLVRNKGAAQPESREACLNDPMVRCLVATLEQWEREIDHRATTRQTAGEVEALQEAIQFAKDSDWTPDILTLQRWESVLAALLARKGE